ncbi:Pin4p [Rhodotorula paludigena]|uniref:Pin4p n=1 Tax=Rhodotorula paludigena TaxID=86838 RepID=UPI003177B064
MASPPGSSLADRFDRLHLAPGTAEPASPLRESSNNTQGTLAAPNQGQRSQRFTVPTSLNSTAASHSPPPPVPSLPYQPPPPPVQAQSATLFHVTEPDSQHYHYNHPGAPHQRSFYSSSSSPSSLSPPIPDAYAPYAQTSPSDEAQYGHYSPDEQYATYPAPPVPPTLAPEFLASPTGMSPYPGPAFRQPVGMGVPVQGPYGTIPSFAGSASGGGFVPQVDADDEIIDTAIVIKNIPFACPKEQLLGLMASLALPAPFAFNYHFAPEDPTAFRGLAFANFRTGEEASVVRAAMDGLEIMNRKLRCEFKKALKPGEKEAIERTKALKRMRSAQLLAAGATHPVGGPPDFAWQRREASAPGGYGGGWASDAQGVAGLGVGLANGHVAGEEPLEDYGRPLSGAGPYGGAHHPRPYGGVGAQPLHPYVPAPPSSFLGVSSASSMPVPLAAAAPPPAAHMEPSYSSESTSPSESDVGTSVSQRMERGGGGSAGSEVGTVATTVSMGVNGTSAAGRNDLDMNDPGTLELYSRVLLFQADSLRDELAFSRSLSSQQRRTVHLIAKKLGLDHRSFGDGEARHVIVYKAGTAPPPEPRRPLRQSLSTAALRRAISRDMLASASPSRTASSSSFIPPPLPTNSSLYSHPSHSSSNGSLSTLATSAAGLRGKKSMPDMRFSSSSSSAAVAAAVGSGPLFGRQTSSSSHDVHSRSSSPVPPLPTSISLQAHLAAYSSGNGYASSASSPAPPNGATPGFTRRSYSNLRSLAEAPSSAASPFATIASYPSSHTSPRKTREIPTVQGLFQQHGIAASAPSTPSRERSDKSGDGWLPGSATPVRQPSGPGALGGTPAAAAVDSLEWRRR